VAEFDPERRRSDRLAVVDLHPQSSTYSRIVGGTDMPGSGDELHHFGWNACSACHCPYAPHPHVEQIRQAGPHPGHLAPSGSLSVSLAAVGVHTAAMLAVTGVIAVVVYDWVGLAFLRRGCINLDLLWTLALVGTG
jgi:hypothetical protein